MINHDRYVSNISESNGPFAGVPVADKKADEKADVEQVAEEAGSTASRALPRLGFVGAGWIGRHRMTYLHSNHGASIGAICEPCPHARAAVSEIVPDSEFVDDLDQLLQVPLDGVVISTPNHLHAEQTMRVLKHGLPVFCQKPLARTTAETMQIVTKARNADRLLSVDFCYRHLQSATRLREMIRQGEIGDVYAVDLTFHNAYGPDKEWFYELAKSGGGCLLDLGIHLADLLLWVFGFPEPNAIQASMYRNGRWLGDQHQQVEDYALANWSFASGVAARLACSWRLHAGRDAVIEAIFYGTQGTLALKNVNGSFFDFCLEQYDGTTSRVLVEPPDDWGGRCIGQFARQIAISPKFHPQADELIAVARLIDRSYGR